MALSEERIKELEGKVAKTKEVYKEAYDRFDVKDMRMIWSGGKDSTLALWICLEFCKENDVPPPVCFTIDEGDAFEEIDEILKKYEKEWGVKLDWVARNRSRTTRSRCRMTGLVLVSSSSTSSRRTWTKVVSLMARTLAVRG